MSKREYIFQENSYIESLSCSIQKFFGLKPSSETLPEVDEILSQKYKHVVLVSLEGLEGEFLEFDLTHRDFMRRHFLNLYPTVLDNPEDAAVKEYAPYKEIIEEINKQEKMKAYEILPENYKNISEWASAVRKTCKRIEKTFTYTKWNQLADIVKTDHKNSNGVYKAMQDLNAEMAFLCEDLEETVFLITAGPETVRVPADGEGIKVPLLWYENKPKRSGLIIYYAIVMFLIIFLLNIIM